MYNKLGYGFLEKVFEKALYIELKKQGLECVRQHPVTVYYESECVGEFFTDIFVEKKIILELKAAELICRDHEMQLINYLRATEAEVGLLLNFGRKPEFKRKIYTNKNIKPR